MEIFDGPSIGAFIIWVLSLLWIGNKIDRLSETIKQTKEELFQLKLSQMEDLRIVKWRLERIIGLMGETP